MVGVVGRDVDDDEIDTKDGLRRRKRLNKNGIGWR